MRRAGDLAGEENRGIIILASHREPWLTVRASRLECPIRPISTGVRRQVDRRPFRDRFSPGRPPMTAAGGGGEGIRRKSGAHSSVGRARR